MVLMAVFIILVFAYSLVSRPLERSVITAPMLFTVAGLATVLLPEATRELVVDQELLLVIAELGLVMLLFKDASRITPSALESDGSVPLRLLAGGMPLTIAIGAVCAVIVLNGLTWGEAAILAVILAPTDAGLGQVIVDSDRVPHRIREALNVEAGLNDGLAVPFLMLFIVLAVAEESTGATGAVLARLVGEQLGYGLLLGIGIGTVGGLLLGFAHRRRWMAPPFRQLGVVALPLLCFIGAEAAAASMFIAAFVAGLTVQFGFKQAGRHSVEFTEDWGQLFNYFVFFFFGTAVGEIYSDFTPAVLLYAVLSLTVVRMVPIAVAMLGTGLSRATVVFMGWFGPRGLASIVLGLVYLGRETESPGNDTIRLAVMATVLLSIAAHGLSAQPGITLYARRIAALDPTAPEHRRAGDDSREPPATSHPGA